jgi:hypothetical protein
VRSMTDIGWICARSPARTSEATCRQVSIFEFQIREIFISSRSSQRFRSLHPV